jgi:hypothetical protein
VPGIPAFTPTTITPTSMTIHVPAASTIVPAARASTPVGQVGGVNGVAAPITLQIQ